MSEVRLIDADALKEVLAKEIKTNDMGLWLKILLVIDNAPTVEAYSEEDMCNATSGGYDIGYDMARRLYERQQVKLANEVWKLYEKYQPHLATRVIEFGNELKELLGKYQEGGAENG